MACFFLFGLWNIRGYAAKPIVVVLDPGHGGENLGHNMMDLRKRI